RCRRSHECLHPKSTSPASARWTQSARPALHAARVPAETRTRIPENPPRKSVREGSPLPVGRSCPPEQRCPAGVAARRPLGCRLVARVELDTLLDECDSGAPWAGSPGLAHILAMSLHPLLALPVA